jgi:hypothetical protein
MRVKPKVQDDANFFQFALKPLVFKLRNLSMELQAHSATLGHKSSWMYQYLRLDRWINWKHHTPPNQIAGGGIKIPCEISWQTCADVSPLALHRGTLSAVILFSSSLIEEYVLTLNHTSFYTRVHPTVKQGLGSGCSHWLQSFYCSSSVIDEHVLTESYFILIPESTQLLHVSGDSEAAVHIDCTHSIVYLQW